MDLIRTTGEDGSARLTNGESLANHRTTGPYILRIQPEHVRIHHDGTEATVVCREDLGSQANLLAWLSDGQSIRVAIPAGQPVPDGTTIRVHLPEEHLKCFDVDAGLAKVLDTTDGPS